MIAAGTLAGSARPAPVGTGRVRAARLTATSTAASTASGRRGA
jgi:hypothetical protein